MWAPVVVGPNERPLVLKTYPLTKREDPTVNTNGVILAYMFDLLASVQSCVSQVQDVPYKSTNKLWC